MAPSIPEMKASDALNTSQPRGITKTRTTNKPNERLAQNLQTRPELIEQALPADSQMESQQHTRLEEEEIPGNHMHGPVAVQAPRQDTWKSQTYTRRHKGAYWQLKELEVGMLFSTEDVYLFREVGEEGQNSKSSGNVFQTPRGHVGFKQRKYVIRQIHMDKAVCLPIYTFENTGLQRKENKNDFVAIRNIEHKGLTETELGVETKENGVLWVERYPDFPGRDSEWYNMKKETNVLLVGGPLINPFYQKVVLFGYLDLESCHLLEKLRAKISQNLPHREVPIRHDHPVNTLKQPDSQQWSQSRRGSSRGGNFRRASSRSRGQSSNLHSSHPFRRVRSRLSNYPPEGHPNEDSREQRERRALRDRGIEESVVEPEGGRRR